MHLDIQVKTTTHLGSTGSIGELSAKF